MIRRLLAAVLALALLAGAPPLVRAANPAPPAAVAKAATNVTTGAATIPGSVDPNGAATTYEVQYGTSDAYGLTTASRTTGAGDDPIAVSFVLSRLTANTVYHYRLVATNAAGIARTADRTFRTDSVLAPVVRTGAAGPVAARAATVTGTVNPRGRATTFRFEYGKGTKLDRRTGRVPVGDGTAQVAVAALLKLAPDTTYSFRLTATNSAGTRRGARRSFRTPAECPRTYPTKLSVARARPAGGAIDVLAPITSRASGRASIEYLAAGRTTRFTVGVDRAARRLRFRRAVTRAQARLGTGILTIRYPGDADTRAQTVRLRAAARPARLDLERPRIADGRIQASGVVDDRARGVVRVQLDYQLDCATRLLEFRAPIADGRWSLDEPLASQTLAELPRRAGAVHSYTLFTGYLPARIRGEMRAFQVLDEP